MLSSSQFYKGDRQKFTTSITMFNNTQQVVRVYIWIQAIMFHPLHCVLKKNSGFLLNLSASLSIHQRQHRSTPEGVLATPGNRERGMRRIKEEICSDKWWLNAPKLSRMVKADTLFCCNWCLSSWRNMPHSTNAALFFKHGAMTYQFLLENLSYNSKNERLIYNRTILLLGMCI